ncbi:Similar to Protein argonaute 12; acc. no. Q7Y001 [Pyronema omphalodes CBS 100304]|uniref:Similar to Protein argonaute 12 acc. no. Q7Y001 n=1 Tax=Pyronema omphalodes (strain CBS 100304) TaxID=1076935 RepID=U4LTU2_PYROM|nr:Similar to Protein argonaute 12; acc. no. Q7Y001 [Pyronema omphalodes CBS 100304]
MRPTVGGMLVNVNVCTKAFYKSGALPDVLSNYFGGRLGQGRFPMEKVRALSGFLRGVRVAWTRLGKTTIHVIEKVTDRTPSQTFFTVNDAGVERKENVEDWFFNAYKVRLRHKEYPCIRLLSQKANAMDIPAEVLAVLPGQPCHDSKLTGEHVSAMIQLACWNPPENGDLITETGLPSLGFMEAGSRKDYLKDFGIEISKKMLVIPARVLRCPRITYANKQLEPGPSWNLRDVSFAKSAKVNAWTVLVVRDGGSRSHQNIPEQALQHSVAGFTDMCRTSGLKMQNVVGSAVEYVTINYDGLLGQSFEGGESEMDRLNRDLENAMKKIAGKGIEFALVILDSVRMEGGGGGGRPKAKQHPCFGPLYSSVKYAGDVKAGVGTVCCQWAKFSNNDKQYWANVALKFNFKMGGTNHNVSPDQLGVLADGKTMLVGCDVTHPSPKSRRGTPSVAGVVASIDPLYTVYPSSLRLQEHRIELITELTEMMVERLEHWNRVNKSFPTKIMVYRDGVSEGEFQKILDVELHKIKMAFSQCGAPTGYNPKVTIIVVGKRHHTRFYPTDPKYTDENGNPSNGTVVDRGVTAVYDFDFFLQAHKGIKGTARPAHYSVLHDEIGFTSNALQELTHNLCYLFARATKSVSIVPPAYYADVLCERGRCYINGLMNATDYAGSSSGHGKGKASDEEKDETMRMARRLWGEGIHPNLRETMFYL